MLNISIGNIIQKLSSDISRTDEAKAKIIRIFKENVCGVMPDISGSDPRHSGREGHWLEDRMGIRHNASNAPDLFGYEMKKRTSGVITLGSWDPNYWMFRDPENRLDRDGFLRAFGQPNPEKGNRMSWSGSPVPKIDRINGFGMRIEVGSEAISFFYSFSSDKRPEKNTLVPPNLQREELEVCKWNLTGRKSLREKVEKKFNQLGWFECIKNEAGAYTGLAFGNPFTFETFLDYFRRGLVYFDCGMYEGNPRNYCQWRSRNSFWDTLISERYEFD